MSVSLASVFPPLFQSSLSLPLSSLQTFFFHPLPAFLTPVSPLLHLFFLTFLSSPPSLLSFLTCHPSRFSFVHLIFLSTFFLHLLSLPSLRPSAHSLFSFHSLTFLSSLPSLFSFFTPDIPLLSPSSVSLSAFFINPLPCFPYFCHPILFLLTSFHLSVLASFPVFLPYSRQPRSSSSFFLSAFFFTLFLCFRYFREPIFIIFSSFQLPFLVFSALLPYFCQLILLLLPFDCLF